MYEWHVQIQAIVDEIDESIKSSNDEALTLRHLAQKLRYSKWHTSRKFRLLSGSSLREYISRRKLAFALIDVRDTRKSFLDIALEYGFSSHEAFTRSFKAAYGISPGAYRKKPGPVMLRTKINTFDRYLFGTGETGMINSSENIKIYFTSIPAHKFMYVRNYESNGYFDFWEKQDVVPGQDCDTVCELLDSIRGKLDGNDDAKGVFSGQIMARINEVDCRVPEAYGVRLPEAYADVVPEHLLLLDVPEAEYIVFEHGPFDFEKECDTAGEALQTAIDEFCFENTGYIRDASPGRISYYFFDPETFMKKVIPVVSVKKSALLKNK